MMATPDLPRRARRADRVLPSGLTGLAGAACAGCCLVPILLAAGILSGAGWAAVAQFLPALAIALVAAAGLAAWWADRRRRHTAGCAGGACSCATQTVQREREGTPVRSAP
jgi:mercuric ion transport protein